MPGDGQNKNMDQTGRFYIVASTKLPIVRKDSATNGRDAVSPINEVPLDPISVLRVLNRHFTPDTVRDLFLPDRDDVDDPGRPQTREALRILKDAWYQEATREGTLVASRGFSRVENCRLNGTGEFQWHVKLSKKEPLRGTMDFATSLQGMTRSQLIRRLCVLWDIVHGMPPSLVAMHLRPKLQAALMFDPQSRDPRRLSDYGFQLAEPDGAPPAVAWKRAQWKVLDLNCLGRPRLMDQGDMAMEDPPQVPHAQCFARLSNWVFSECEAVRRDVSIGLVSDQGPNDIVLGGNYRFDFLVGNPPPAPAEDEQPAAAAAAAAPRRPAANAAPRVDEFADDEQPQAAVAGAPRVVVVPPPVPRRSSRRRNPSALEGGVVSVPADGISRVVVVPSPCRKSGQRSARNLQGGSEAALADDTDESEQAEDGNDESEQAEDETDESEEADVQLSLSAGTVFSKDMSLSDWESMSMLSVPTGLTQIETQALAKKGTVLKNVFQTRKKPKVISYETILRECGEDITDSDDDDNTLAAVEDVAELVLIPGESVVPEFASTLEDLTECSSLLLKLLVAQKIISTSVGPKQIALEFPGLLVPVRTKDSARTEHVLSSRGVTTFVLGSKRGMQTWHKILYAFFNSCRLGASLTLLHTSPFVHMDRRRSVRDSVLHESSPRLLLPTVVVESLKLTPSSDRNFLYTWCRDFYRQVQALVQ